MNKKIIYYLYCFNFLLIVEYGYGQNFPASPLEKPGYKLTFHDEFDRPILNDLYWYSAYRTGRCEYGERIGRGKLWYDNNAYYLIQDGILKLRIDEKLPYRPQKTTPCVSCITTSDHRFGKTLDTFQILEKFSQKYGWFEVRCKCPSGEGLLSSFWLHQSDPTKQEYTPEGRRKYEAGPVEIDIFEQQGRFITETSCDAYMAVYFAKDAVFRPRFNINSAKDFHVWAMEWQEGQIDWYLDGNLVKTYRGPTPQEKMFILLGFFQYSGWIGQIDPNLVYPKDFEIDYIRVYSKE